MRYKGFDLNLLGVFDTLMRTRNVSRAAEELNLSQPAISSALKRLRMQFGDEILVPQGKKMMPTAYAEALLPHVRDTLHAVDGLMASSARFDPAESQRTFRICSSDYLATALFAPLSLHLSSVAPHVHLELVLNDEHSFVQLEQGQVDLVCTPEGYSAPDMPTEHLLDERHVVVGWRENPLLASPIDEATFLAAGQVSVAIGSLRTPAFSNRAMALLGKHPRFEVTASSFTIVPFLLVGSQRLALMHERLALLMAQQHALAIVEIPFDFPIMREVVQYHPARANDPGLLWLRERLREQAKIDKYIR
jgi:DNA-binding transcriptional LysR family regulator